jgi:hypothetical protein
MKQLAYELERVEHKKGLKRIWVIGSVLCFLCHLTVDGKAYNFSVDVSINISFLIVWVFNQIIWWGLLYLGFWVARDFFEDDNKKVGF